MNQSHEELLPYAHVHTVNFRFFVMFQNAKKGRRARAASPPPEPAEDIVGEEEMMAANDTRPANNVSRKHDKQIQVLHAQG